MKRFVIAIDPDLTLSGVAIWDRKEKKWIRVELVAFEDMVAWLEFLVFTISGFDPDNTIIYVEAGYLNKQANFRRGHRSSVSENIAMRVGMNHATSILTSRVLKKQGWEVVEIAPLSKGGGLLKKDGVWTKTGKDHIKQHSGYTGKLKSGEEFDSVFIVMHFR